MKPTQPNTLEGPKPEFIKKLFSSISKDYDKANNVITWGIAHQWRRTLVHWSGATDGDQVLDCATGTGDLAIEFKKAVGPEGSVLGTDFCQEMLHEAKIKVKAAKVDIDFQLADTTGLNYEANTFDVTSIAFGIRNVLDPLKALSEMARVTKPGGSVMVLETGNTQVPLFKSAFRFYFKNIVPLLGGWVTGNKPAYQYLNKSSSQFPSGSDFTNFMRRTGQFQSAKYQSLMGGSCFLYKGVKKALCPK